MDSRLESKAGESSGLTRIDIAKHALKTVLATMNDNDVCSLVVYSDLARVVFTQCVMTASNKTIAFSQIERLYSMGTTNMWAGMELAFDILQRCANIYPNQHMMVLTDGANPTVPPKGFAGSMAEIKAKNEGNYPCIVHTFGFAYDLDSILLNDIAKEGNGMYAFIPDGTMVGTVFINAFANAATTIGRNARVAIEVDSAYLLDVEGEQGTFQKQTWGGVWTIPLLQESREWTCCLHFDKAVNLDQLAFQVTYMDTTNGSVQKTSEVHPARFSPEGSLGLLRARHAVISAIADGLTLGNASGLTRITAILSSLPQTAEIVALQQDMAGQVTEALSVHAYFLKWGRHYLPSLKRAHEMQQCNNFKDPGVQTYVSPLFESIRTVAEQYFTSLPPPRSAAMAQRAQQPVAMARYLDRSGGCIYGECQVRLADGRLEKVERLRKGDRLASGAIIRCVVHSPYYQGTEFVQLKGGLKITKWHPVQVDSVWQFPSEVAHAKEWVPEESEGIMYSFLLESSFPSIEVEGYSCAALGHGITEDKVAAHAFLGTDRVVAALSKCRGFEDGQVFVLYGRQDASSTLSFVSDLSSVM
jgi:hypothetical protein